MSLSREDLIQAGVRAIGEQYGTPMLRGDVGIVIDAVEALIRADERAQIADGLWTSIVPITDWIAGVNMERAFREEHPR